MAQLKLTDEPVKQLRALQDAMRIVRCNKQSRQYYHSLDEHLQVLVPAMGSQISSMIDAAAFGESLKQGQLKALQVDSRMAYMVCRTLTDLYHHQLNSVASARLTALLLVQSSRTALH